MSGPPPKRQDQRRRVNKPAVPVEVAETAAPVVPPADHDWHPVAVRWYEALGTSGGSAFYTDADWATAYAISEAMSREFMPQPIVLGKGEDKTVEWVKMPPKAAFLAAWLKACAILLATEGDRRRLHLELVRKGSQEEAEPD